MNVATLSVLAKIDGVNNVVNGMKRIHEQGVRNNETLSRATAAMSAYATGALAISAASLTAYDSFVRFEMGAKSLMGTLNGAAWAKSVQKMAVISAYNPEMLRKGALGLLSTGVAPGRAQNIMNAVSNIGAAGGTSNEEMQRVFLALRQVQSKGGTVRAEEVNQQLAEAMPLLIKTIRDATGRDPIGMKTSDFFDAIVKQGNGKFGGAQSALASASPFIAIQNFGQLVMNSLIPTGRLLAITLGLILTPLTKVVDVFNTLNEMTGGLLGLGIIAFLVGGVISKFGALIATATGLSSANLSLLSSTQILQLAFSQLSTRILTGKFSDFSGIPTGGKNLHLGQMMPTGTPGVFTMGGKATSSLADDLSIKGVGAIGKDFLSGGIGSITNVFSKVVQFIKPLMNLKGLLKIGVWTTVIIAAIDIIPRLFANLGKIFGWIGDKLGGVWNQVKQSPIGKAFAQIFDFLGKVWETIVSALALDWLVKLMGIEDEKPDQGNAAKISNALSVNDTARRPMRRADAENFWYSRMADAL